MVFIHLTVSDPHPRQISFFIQDYENAAQRAVSLDERISNDAADVSNQYADLVSLAARQAMAGTELTISRDTSDQNNFNMSDVKMFMKYVGSPQNG